MGVMPMRKLAPLLCAAALTLSLAVPAGAYYASNEDGSNEPGGPITSVSVTTEPVAEPTLPSLGGLTPDGNLALIDDILGGAFYSSEEVGDSQMQFVTVESKNGNTFYLVIDHATGDVYFLNLVDEADLLALLEDEGYEVECNCDTRCQPGEVDKSCPVCRTELNECVGAEPEPTPEPTDTPVTEPQEDNDNGFNASALLPNALIVVLGAGGAYYVLRVRKRKPDTSGSTDLDDYDFPEDDDEVK